MGRDRNVCPVSHQCRAPLHWQSQSIHPQGLNLGLGSLWGLERGIGWIRPRLTTLVRQGYFDVSFEQVQ